MKTLHPPDTSSFCFLCSRACTCASVSTRPVQPLFHGCRGMAPPDKADSGRDEDSLPAQSVAGPGLSARGNRKGISPCLWGMPSHNLDICGCLKEEKGQVHPYPQVSAFSPAPSFYPTRKKFVKLFQLCGADDGQTRLIYEKRTWILLQVLDFIWRPQPDKN